jgi:imidazolonepropionase-like amidohydrolase
MKLLIRYTLVLALGVSITATAGEILFTNVNVFDGTSDKLKSHDVLIEDNLIKQVGKNITAPEDATVKDLWV